MGKPIWSKWANDHDNAQLQMLQAQTIPQNFEWRKSVKQLQIYMGSTSLAANHPPARTMTTIPLQPRGLRGKKQSLQNFAHDTTGFSVMECAMLRYDNQKRKNCSKMKGPLKALEQDICIYIEVGPRFHFHHVVYKVFWHLTEKNSSNVMDVQ